MKKNLFGILIISIFAVLLVGCKKKTNAKPVTTAKQTQTTVEHVTTKKVEKTTVLSVDYDAILEAAKAKVKISGVATAANRDFTVTDSLSYKHTDGVTYQIALSWASSNSEVIALNGLQATVTRPEDSDKVVTLTCTMTLEGHTATKEFPLDVYKKEITPEEILAQAKPLLDQMVVELGADNVTTDVTLPTVAGLAGVSWASENIDYITANGNVFRPEFGEGDKQVKMTATLTSGTATQNVEYTFVVKEQGQPEDSKIAELASRYITFEKQEGLTENITLPTEGRFGTTISWSSSDASIIKADGTVIQPAPYNGSVKNVTLTATVTYKEFVAVKKFKFTVNEKAPATDEEKAYVAFNKLGNDLLVVVDSTVTLNNSANELTFTFASSTDGITVDNNVLTIVRKAKDYIAKVEAKTTIGSTEYSNFFQFLVKASEKGDGSVENPFVIESAEDLMKVGTGIDNWNLDSNYVLMNDIDLTGKVWAPIGNDKGNFTGTFNGHGFTISNLTYNNETVQSVGLFGITKGAILKNVKLKGFKVTGKLYVSCLVGKASDTSIYNVFVSDSVVEAMNSGDCVSGCIAGSFMNSTPETKVYIENVSVKNSVVFGQANCGLVVGQFRSVHDPEAKELTVNAFFKNGYAQGDVYGCRYTGGFIGAATGTLENIVSVVNLHPIEKYKEGVQPFNTYNANGGVFSGLSSTSALTTTSKVTLKNVLNLGSMADFNDEVAGRKASVISNKNTTPYMTLENIYSVEQYSANGNNKAYTDGYTGIEIRLEKALDSSWIEANLGFDMLDVWKMVSEVGPELMFNDNVGLETYVVESFINIPNASNENLVFVTDTLVRGIKISYSSNNEAIISNTGIVTRPAYKTGDQTVKITVTFFADEKEQVREYEVKVSKVDPTVDEMYEDVEAQIKEALTENREISSDISLITTGAWDATISWASDNAAIGTDGKVVRPEYGQLDASVKLTATVTIGSNEAKSYNYTFTVKAWGKEAKAISDAKALVTIAETVTENLTLPTQKTIEVSGENVDVTIAWASDNEAINANGTVTRPAYLSGDASVKLTATFTCGSRVETVEYNVIVTKVDPVDADYVEEAIAILEAIEKNLKANVALPTFENGVAVTGAQVKAGNSYVAIGLNELVITQPAYTLGDQDYEVELTLAKGEATKKYTFSGKVLKYYGAGTESDPFLVDSVDSLKALANSDKYYKLMADIDLSTVCSETLGNWAAIVGFKGVLDGNGHSIKNLYINAKAQYNALFKSVYSSTIKNLVLDSFNITNTAASNGCLIGKVEQGSNVVIENVTIINSTINANLGTSDSTSAGLIGFVDLRTDAGSLYINNVYVECDVNGSSATGGFIGQIRSGKNVITIKNSMYKGTVKGYKNSGIFIGAITREGTVDSSAVFTVENCIVHGVIKNNDVAKNTMTSVGGFVGQLNMSKAQPVVFKNNIGNQIDFETSQYNWSGTFFGRCTNMTGTNITLVNCMVYGQAYQQTGTDYLAGCYSGVSIAEENIASMDYYKTLGFSDSLFVIADGKLSLKKLTDITDDDRCKAAFDDACKAIPAETIVDIVLPTSGLNGATIVWSSDNAALTNAGVATRPTTGVDANVTLTAEVTVNGTTKSYTVVVKVLSISKEEIACTQVKEALEVAAEITGNVTLKTSENVNVSDNQVVVSIAWVSSNTTNLAADGTVTRPTFTAGDKTAHLTATITAGDYSTTKEFDVTIKKADKTKEEVALDMVKDALTVAESVSANITLSTSETVTALEQSVTVTIAWASNDETTITTAGVVTRPAADQQDKIVKLTATITCGDFSTTKEFNVTVVKESSGNSATSVANQKTALQGIPTELTQNVNLEEYLLGECTVSVEVTVGGDYLKYRYDHLVLNRVVGGEDQTVKVVFTITCESSNDTYEYNGTVKAIAAQGTGTQSDPMYVYDTTTFLGIVKDKYYIMSADIEFTGTQTINKNAANLYLDGDYHIVKGFSFSAKENSSGMFYVVTKGRIENIIFDTCSATNTNSRTGLLIGMVNGGSNLYINNIKMINCSVSGTDYVGCLIGRVDGKKVENLRISNVYVDATITSSAGMAGGLIGGITCFGTNASGMIINDIYTTGAINVSVGKKQAGGIIGFASHTYKDNSIYYGTPVNGEVLSLSNCVSAMNITCDQLAGGIMGFIESNAVTDPNNSGVTVLGTKSFTNCIFLGTIQANGSTTLTNSANILARDNGNQKTVGTNIYTRVEGTNANLTGKLVGTVLTAEQLTSWEFYEGLGFSNKSWKVSSNGIILR